MQVVVYIRFECDVPYLINVDDPNNSEEIRKALREKNPADWETEPNFHENLGSNWQHFITQTKNFAPSCPECGHPIEVVSTMSDCYILGCPVHREYDKVLPL